MLATTSGIDQYQENRMTNKTQIVEMPSGSRYILFGAAVFTLLWLTGAAVVIYFFHGKSLEPAKLNEWGDFVAGVSAPIAFIWLVVAVLIQSTELREQRRELALTREEFAHNRTVMEAQAKEAKRQAEFIEKQTSILAETHSIAQAETVFAANLDLVSTRLRQYPNAWSIEVDDDFGESRIPANAKISLSSNIYDGITDNLAIATTVKSLRTKIRALRDNYPRDDLRAQFPHDFQRILRAVHSSTEAILKLPASFVTRADTLELFELRKQSEYLAERADINRHGPTTVG
jgi:hypothetical protein